MPTFIFCVVGIFVPAFSALLLFGIQMLLTKLGIECSNAWKIIWMINYIGMIASPILYIKYLASTNHQKEFLKANLILFNSLEYIFIQVSLGSLLSDSKMLCYGTDGQNGLELVFTAWLSLPILFIFSFICNYIWARKD